MTKQKFNISDWLPEEENKNSLNSFSEQPQNLSLSKNTDSVTPDIELIISRLEAQRIDITANYSDWRDIGFALADEFGENGRDYFHRISRFYPGYSISNADSQYNNCLKAKGHGITMKTIFHLAKQSGVDINCVSSSLRIVSSKDSDASQISDSPVIPNPENAENTDRIFNTSTLPNEIYSNLPEILRESCDLFQEGIEKDVFLIGSIAVLSGCLPKIEGIYFDEKQSAHLFTFITAPAGSGKGKMKWSKYFGQVIHRKMVEQSKNERATFESEMEAYNNLTRKERQDNEKPEEPPRKMFFIPANSSSSAFIQALADNNFSGIIFETEADTLANTFKQEWGNFSDILRKAFHHESTSMFRRKDNEYIEIIDPHIAIVLSGTPKQVHHVMPDPENGLFSRFLYYAFEDNSEFKNPFISYCQVDYTNFFEEKATTIFELFKQLNKLNDLIKFKLTEEQGLKFTEIFNAMLSRNKLLLGRDFDANTKRLGLITFRIAMILSALRILEDGEFPNPMICSDLDFETAITIATTLEKHAIAVFQNLPNNSLSGIKLKFYEKLPAQFDRQGYLKVAAELGIQTKAAEKYIGQFKPKLLHHEHNLYIKITKSQNRK
ncbi:MAG TPA: DUF3987 domain-containing protein [Prolixibacteraceae bacterium]|nr:DUF3987 domain-containing protein [Prolixibacteraceae bacterium]